MLNVSYKFHDDFNLSIHYVDQIPRKERGKYKFLIQKLPVEFVQYDFYNIEFFLIKGTMPIKAGINILTIYPLSEITIEI